MFCVTATSLQARSGGKLACQPAPHKPSALFLGGSCAAIQPQIPVSKSEELYDDLLGDIRGKKVSYVTHARFFVLLIAVSQYINHFSLLFPQTSVPSRLGRKPFTVVKFMPQPSAQKELRPVSDRKAGLSGYRAEAQLFADLPMADRGESAILPDFGQDPTPPSISVNHWSLTKGCSALVVATIVLGLVPCRETRVSFKARLR